MYALLVRLEVVEGQVETFLRAAHANQAATRREPGNLRFDVLRSPGHPHRFLLYEVYRSAADHAAHRETNHFRCWRAAIEPILAAPREAEDWEWLAGPDSGDALRTALGSEA